MADLKAPDWKISLDLSVYQRIKNYSEAADGEWSGLGIFEMTPTGPLVTSLYLLEQESSQADTEIDEVAAGRLAFELASKGLPCDLNVWVHSHGTMPTFWSTKDEKDGVGTMLNAPPFLVSIVTNKAGDLLGRIDTATPFRLTMNKVPVTVELRRDDAQYAADVAEVRQKVRQPTLTRTSMPNFSARGSGDLGAYFGRNDSQWGVDCYEGYGQAIRDTNEKKYDDTLHVWGLDASGQEVGWNPVEDANEAEALFKAGRITPAAYEYLDEVFTDMLSFELSAADARRRLADGALGVEDEDEDEGRIIGRVEPDPRDLDDFDLTEEASGRYHQLHAGGASRG